MLTPAGLPGRLPTVSPGLVLSSLPTPAVLLSAPLVSACWRDEDGVSSRPAGAGSCEQSLGEELISGRGLG